MPRLSVWLIRTALAYLALGFTLGGLMLFNKGLPLAPAFWRLLPMHIEFVLFGWTIQLAMGVGFWILPRFVRGPARGDERRVWAAYVLLNAGVLSVSLGQWLAWPAWIPLLGRAAELLAVAAFALHAWPRIKPHGM
ncbi:MAG TPA: cbb3-type cytochrome c oxidase subunit I [Anaerolineales bacterium]|nr:cbb3-type cytochrome c oxidase subunit I [Anaerolineales bacterium]